ncbi:5-oxoprolinase subunit PxpA [Photobacterium sp. TY1-4]|uniref:5-oxoprolinase subunit PxpA n=1 Tax=Photobacterium sp. TY1-4 TaxID=2899122 RepID=UPI0021BFBA23|nr:5-oxoprolinase subunit PxpA [Photobacterium sp. TY1-4]UXI04319.1 5-oxoprolinase subunit PxpA [Photobacterium sp. TY1-4]
MKINCDMGESFGIWNMGNDAQVMPYLNMANIACGMHASDPTVMLNTVRLAKQYQVTIGAHPGYADLQGFGRRPLNLGQEELAALFTYQIGALVAICQSESMPLSYVKPHGALYNTMMKDDQVFTTLLAALHRYDASLPLVVMAVPNHDHYQAMADEYGIELWFEAFVDRAYGSDGRLMPRSEPGSSYHELAQIRRQAAQLIEHGSVTTLAGEVIPVRADTLCIHGDGPQALPTAQLLQHLLQQHLLQQQQLQQPRQQQPQQFQCEQGRDASTTSPARQDCGGR